MQVYKQLRREDPAAYQPLVIAIKQAKCLPPHVSGLEVYNAFKFAFGYPPSRDDEGRCIYTQTQLEIVAATCSIEAIYLSELEQWRKLVPLAGCQSRRAAMHKLSRVGGDGWLLRCSYKRGKLMLCKEDAELLCYVSRNGYGAVPARWSLPTVCKPVAS
jgi:hypothetical protein